MPAIVWTRGRGVYRRMLSSFKPSHSILSSNSSPVRYNHVLGWARPSIINSNQFKAASLSTSARILSKRTCLYEDNGETYIRSPYPDAQIPNVPFTEFVFSYLDKYKNLELVVDNPSGRSYTGSQMKESTIRVASALHRLGYRKRDVVLVFSTNCPEYILLFLACGLLGCPVCTANPALTPGELGRQLSHCEATCIVTITDLLPTVTAAIATQQNGGHTVKEIITIDGPADNCRPFQTLLDDDGRSLPDNVHVSPREDVLVMPYSSGTTGMPKGVMLSHYNLVANLTQGMQGPLRYKTGDEDILLGVLPFFHIYGILLLMVTPLLHGTKIVIMPKFEPQLFLQAVQKHKMTYINLVPPIMLFLAKHPMVDEFDLSSVNTVVSGAAPLGAGAVREVENRLNVNCIQAYGSTELMLVTLDEVPARAGSVGRLLPNIQGKLTNADRETIFSGYGSTELMLVTFDEVPARVGSVGRLLPNIQGKVIDIKTGKSLPPGEEGELIFSGPNIMLGYLKNRAATDDCIKHGWQYTGDIGRVDEDGYFTVTDRLKELIKYKAYPVAPAELEALLCTHNSIQDAAVIGLKAGEEVGEIPKAFVVAKPGVKVTEEEIVKFVEENVAPYKRLRGGVEFVSEIPKTPSGKILRRLFRN